MAGALVSTDPEAASSCARALSHAALSFWMSTPIFRLYSWSRSAASFLSCLICSRSLACIALQDHIVPAVIRDNLPS